MRAGVRIHYADSERDADMLYATGFFAPDAFLFIEVRGRRMMLLSDLEFDRGEKQGRTDEVLSLTFWAKKAKEKFSKAGMAEIIAALIQNYKVREVEVPPAFPLGLTRRLESLSIRVRVCEGDFFPERIVKRKDEIRHIEIAQRATERAVAGAVAMIAGSKIRGRRLVYKGATLTADAVRAKINGSLMEQSMIPAHSIVAPGEQATDPHNEGHGPIRPGEAVVMDIFPRSEKTGYFADMTRTVVKGRPSEALLGLYAAVQAAQEAGLKAVKAGVSGAEVHGKVEEVLKGRGYTTERKNGKMQGFFHGTGHGVGLQIHEEPRVSRGGQPLPVNSVVTVEPGLYYPGIGGVRLEDMVVVKRGGSENLTKFPKVFRV